MKPYPDTSQPWDYYQKRFLELAIGNAKLQELIGPSPKPKHLSLWKRFKIWHWRVRYCLSDWLYPHSEGSWDD